MEKGRQAGRRTERFKAERTSICRGMILEIDKKVSVRRGDRPTEIITRTDKQTV